MLSRTLLIYSAFRWALEKSVKCGAIYQSPENCKELQIIGVNASALNDLINSGVDTLSGFSISTANINDLRHVKEYSKHFKVEKYHVNRQEKHFEASAKCDLVLQGETNEIHHSEDAYYVAVPAHLVLDHGNCEALAQADNPIPIAEMRSEIEGTASFKRYSFSQESFAENSDLEYFPMFTYAHCLPSEQPTAGYNAFSRDFALLRIRQNQLNKKDCVPLDRIEVATKCKKRIYVHKSRKVEDIVNIDQIFPLQYASTLDKMGELGVWVMVGQETYTGYMIPTGCPITGGSISLAASIEFVSETR